MSATQLGKKAVDFILLSGSLLLPLALHAQEVGLAGIMGNKALLIINGAAPRAVPLGATLDGVKLLAVQENQVIIELDGRKRPLRVGQHAQGTSSATAEQVVLKADSRGHFITNGTINGVSLRFWWIPVPA